MLQVEVIEHFSAAMFRCESQHDISISARQHWLTVFPLPLLASQDVSVAA